MVSSLSIFILTFIKSINSSLAVSFPALSIQCHSHIPGFPPLTSLYLPSKETHLVSQNRTHKISAFSDLSITLDIPSSNLRFFLVRGSPFLTAAVTGDTELSIITTKKILKFSSDNSLTKYSSCYPVSGKAVFKKKPFSLKYRWNKKGKGDLLILAHPLHIQLLTKNSDITILKDFKYRSVDGELVGIVGDSWVLKTDPIPVTWNSIRGIKEESYAEIISALSKDVEALNSTAVKNTTSSYFYGKLVGRAARLALIAEEVYFLEVIPVIKKFLKDTIEPWLDGTFSGNGFLYDRKWGGIITKQGSNDSTADFGFGIFNDHHYHLGYFLYGIAVLAKIDPAWGRKSFDLYKLHSWAAGLHEFENGRNQESSSEAVNGYYSAALMGLAYGDINLVAIGSTLTALEICAAQTWWHVKEETKIYEEEFSRDNRVVGILWANMRDSKLWWAPAECRECRFSIQVLPLSPITEVVFSDVDFVQEFVKWTSPALKKKDIVEGWKGFIYALQGLYDKESALKKIRKLKGFDDGNSHTNLLWWIHSRGGD
ncbi:Endo-1,3(4)-beta-glucanase [Quillaja saponaria]|uniref:glucan endo-1,3-beta-D-glucosidase n=1 Tax=Quillaja saponaria TaxID=32244 RepID=A0AAD7PXU3_QUISA|nr:Endo-1,3(4)-beta-glucanase [Quillaja saponaria]